MLNARRGFSAPSSLLIQSTMGERGIRMLSNPSLHLDRLASKQKLLRQEFESNTVNENLGFYTRIIPRALGAERCSVFIHSPQDKKVWLKAGTNLGEKAIEVKIEDSIVGEVIAFGKAILRADLETRGGAHKDVDTLTGFKTREVLCVPVRAAGREEVTGAIQVLNKINGHFTQEDQHLVEEVAARIQSEVDHAFLSQEVLGNAEKIMVIARRTVVTALIIFWVCVGIIVLVFGLYAITPLLGI